MSDQVLDPGPIQRPTSFARSYGGWVPWLAEPAGEEADWVADFGESRAARPTFRITASDRSVAATMAAIEDSVIDHVLPEQKDGLARQDRELAAFVTSRVNGCLDCTTFHALRFGQYSGDRAAAQRILKSADQAELSLRNKVLVDAAVALTATPPTFGQAEVEALAAQGLDAGEMLDFIHNVAYFSYANRVMLTVGEPTVNRTAAPAAQDAT
jgi:uncharacterized peroxidase-related enzyme